MANDQFYKSLFSGEQAFVFATTRPVQAPLGKAPPRCYFFHFVGPGQLQLCSKTFQLCP